MQPKRELLELEKASVETCGSKAASCAELARLAKQQEGFSTPEGVCLPFGNMEYSLQVRSSYTSLKLVLTYVSLFYKGSPLKQTPHSPEGQGEIPDVSMKAKKGQSLAVQDLSYFCSAAVLP